MLVTWVFPVSFFKTLSFNFSTSKPRRRTCNYQVSGAEWEVRDTAPGTEPGICRWSMFSTIHLDQDSQPAGLRSWGAVPPLFCTPRQASLFTCEPHRTVPAICCSFRTWARMCHSLSNDLSHLWTHSCLELSVSVPPWRTLSWDSDPFTHSDFYLWFTVTLHRPVLSARIVLCLPLLGLCWRLNMELQDFVTAPNGFLDRLVQPMESREFSFKKVNYF